MMWIFFQVISVNKSLGLLSVGE